MRENSSTSFQYQNADGWWFSDSSGKFTFGPFSDQEECNIAQAAFVDILAGKPVTTDATGTTVYENGGWWACVEDGAYKHGPFGSEEDASKALLDYAFFHKYGMSVKPMQESLRVTLPLWQKVEQVRADKVAAINDAGTENETWTLDCGAIVLAPEVFGVKPEADGSVGGYKVLVGGYYVETVANGNSNALWASAAEFESLYTQLDHAQSYYGQTDSDPVGVSAPEFEEEATTATPTLEQDLAAVINRHSLENQSDTPDFVLARAVIGFLTNFANAVGEREKWYGRDPRTLHVALGLGEPLVANSALDDEPCGEDITQASDQVDNAAHALQVPDGVSIPEDAVIVEFQGEQAYVHDGKVVKFNDMMLPNKDAGDA